MNLKKLIIGAILSLAGLQASWSAVSGGESTTRSAVLIALTLGALYITYEGI